MNISSVLMCPVCRQGLQLHDKTWRCDAGHSYDVAKQGYVNLHVVQHKHSKTPGDTPASVAARNYFLEAGFYAPLQQALLQQLTALQPQTLLDIGCGEGYYTTAMQSQVIAQCVGVDIAKNAIQRAAKRSKNVTWVVATGSTLPVMDTSIEVCCSLFSPIPVAEILRVLCERGYLIIATPAALHLQALRAALFDQVEPHQPEKFLTPLLHDFELKLSQTICSDMILAQSDLQQLIAMTPYAYKAKPEKIQALQMLPELALQAQFQLYVLQRKPHSV